MRTSSFVPLVAVVAIFSVLLFLSGCGGNASPAPSTPASPTPASTTPAATPPASGGSGTSGSGSGGSGSGGSGSSTATTQWQASIGSHGSVTVDTTGQVLVDLKSATPNTSYSVQFCQFQEWFFANKGQQPCFEVAKATTDAGGNWQQSFHFPRPGGWSGQFAFVASGQTYLNPSFETGGSGNEGLITNANSGEWTGSDPLKSGSLSTDGSNVTVTLTGAAANATYVVTECGTYGESGCYQLNWVVMTDASGNGKASGPGEGGPSVGDLDFTVGRKNGPNEFVTGFNVP